MGTEIGARNLADHDRYNMLPAIAEIFNLDTTKHASLWRDRALVELNIAVLHSFKEDGVSIVDHHTALSSLNCLRRQKNQQEEKLQATGHG